MAKAARGRKKAASLLEEHRRKIHDDWAARHPRLARQERALRKAQALASDSFGHKVNGTVETHAKAARTRQGAVARLYTGGSLSVDQLGAALEIAHCAAAIARGLTIRTVSLETRVDGSSDGNRAFFETLGAVRREIAFSRWRRLVVELGGREALGVTCGIVIEDRGLREMAVRWRMRDARARQLLTAALDLWDGLIRAAAREIDEADLDRRHAALLGR